MERVEERLQIGEEKKDEDVKVQEQLLIFAEQLAKPEITFSERLSIAEQLRVLFGAVCHAEPVEAHEHAPPDSKDSQVKNRDDGFLTSTTIDLLLN
jgi:hypothetical protein